MAEYVVKGAEPKETVLHTRTPNGYESWEWLPVREEIVRCRDCEYATNDGYGCKLFGRPEQTGSYRWVDVPAEVEPEGFCKWSVRRSDD